MLFVLEYQAFCPAYSSNLPGTVLLQFEDDLTLYLQ